MQVSRVQAGLGLATIAVVFGAAISAAERNLRIDVSSLPAIGEVDERFQAFNIEMLEVTGGRFWKPYKDTQTAGLYAYRFAFVNWWRLGGRPTSASVAPGRTVLISSTPMRLPLPNRPKDSRVS